MFGNLIFYILPAIIIFTSLYCRRRFKDHVFLTTLLSGVTMCIPILVVHWCWMVGRPAGGCGLTFALFFWGTWPSALTALLAGLTTRFVWAPEPARKTWLAWIGGFLVPYLAYGAVILWAWAAR